MNVFLTGATGFVGTAVLDALISAGHQVTCLVRSAKSATNLPDTVEVTVGDILEPDSYRDVLGGQEAVINLVGIIEEKKSAGVTFERLHTEATGKLTEAAAESGVKIYIQMSANGARENGVSRYQTSKWKADQIVKKAGFDSWTVFKPSFMFGDPGPDNPEFAKRLAQTLIKPFPILPVFGDGKYRLQPVAVKDVAAAFSQALTKAEAANRSYIVTGKESFTYNEALDMITRACGYEPKKKLHQPVMLARPLVHTLGRVGLLPISPDQFEMLLEGNTGNSTAFFTDFDLEEIPFTVDNLTYVQKYL